VATYRIWIPAWRPPATREWVGRHWSVLHRLKRQTADLLALYRLAEPRVPDATGPRKVRLAVRLAPGQRRHDADAFDKVLLDSLVTCGLLLDDSGRGLVGRVGLSFSRARSPGEVGTLITLTDVEEAPR
jgi:hypothetical protein